MKTTHSFSSALCFAIFFTLFSPLLSASIVVSGTRVIYPSEAREVSVKVTNMGTRPVLIQSWIDNGDMKARPENIHVPFVLTPPFNRIDTGKGQTLRISLTDPTLPEDRESLFWLNVLEVPAKNKQLKETNYLQMAFRTRIKFFYRPAGLPGNASDTVKTMKWYSRDGQITASNLTPYYASLANVTLGGKKVDGKTVAPFQSQTFNLSGKPGDKVSGEFVNDFGAVLDFSATLQE
ncbi:fimbrial biogenesis chaperone [Erwinia amylovora]